MTDNAQHALWNGPAGQAWVQAQSLLDGMFAPFAARLASAIPPDAPMRVLDLGCGTGAVSLAIAARLGAEGRCTGVDISAPMIDVARERACRSGRDVDFIVADAQRHTFAPGSFDHLVSRFGVMFFDDPVQAFTRLRHATRRGGTLQALSWRSPSENPFMTAAERAAAPLLDLPPRVVDAPGQFAFADRERVLGLLAASGWREIDVVAVDTPCTISTDELQRYIALLGPVGAMLRDPQLEADKRATVLRVVEQAFAPFVHGHCVHFVAACWELRAVAP